MKKMIVCSLAALLVFVLVACQPQPIGSQIEVQEPWARSSPAGVNNGAAFMVLVNSGSEDDTLIGATSPAAAAVEVHQTTMENDVMKMMPLEVVLIPAQGQVEFAPGGYHVMLIGLVEPFVVGDTFEITFVFEKFGEVFVSVEVVDP